MITLIKRDLLSTKNVWFFVLLALGIVWAFLSYIILQHPGEVVELLVIPAFLTVFFGYGLVAHVCRVEDLNRVNERVLQLPVHHHVLILSRYLTSFLLVAILLVINLAFFGVLSFFSDGKLFTFNEISTYGYLLFQLLILIILLYLPFYFAKSSNVATWSIRISVFLWLLYTFLLPLFYFERIHRKYVPDQYYDHLGVFLFLFTLLLVPISFASSTSSFRLKRLRKRNLLPLASLCVIIFIVFAGVAKIAESKSLSSVADILMDTKVENVKVKAFPAYQYDEGETPVQYRVLVTIEFSNDSFSENKQLVYTEPIYVQVSGSTRDYLGLNGFEVPFEWLFSSHYVGRDKEERKRYAYEIEAPNFLTEEEKVTFLANFTEEDFTVFIESKWLNAGRHLVDWRKR
ncbi:MAG: ABC-2 transporter permease [Anaerobacillus sp.]|uniref:ABC-2 transporter permease n=1 Tax=Anaerobacillus sp. TaxID=1872506 RepID=UPI00391A23BF